MLQLTAAFSGGGRRAGTLSRSSGAAAMTARPTPGLTADVLNFEHNAVVELACRLRTEPSGKDTTRHNARPRVHKRDT